MMGRSHALTGWSAGLAAAPFLGQHSLAGAVVVGSVTAGFALLPDLDHRSSTASRLLGPVTDGISRLFRGISRAVYLVTKGPRDEPGGAHRQFWHTGVAAALLGWLANLGVHAGGRWAALSVIVFGVLLAVAALGDWVLIPAVGGGVLATVAAHGHVTTVLDGSVGWLGWAVAVGCLTHDLGDALTQHGCPLLFPLPIAGETYAEIRLPKALRFHTSGRGEQMLFWLVFTPAAVLLIPGVWSTLTRLV